MVLIRAAMLRGRGVRALVFGRTHKSDFLLVPLVLSILYTLLANPLSLPMWSLLVRPFWSGTALGWVGIALCAVSIVGFALTLASFGNSFRVGIDDVKPDKLITNGMFAFTRNPIYVCFFVFFIGLLLIHRNMMISISVAIFALAIHRQILREEVFLASHYGAEYKMYRKKVRRYL